MRLYQCFFPLFLSCFGNGAVAQNFELNTFFFGPITEETILAYNLIATFSDQQEESFLLRSELNSKLYFFHRGNSVELEGTNYKYESLDKGVLILRSDSGIVAKVFESNRGPEEAVSVAKLANQDMRLLSNSKAKQNPTRGPLAFYDGEVNIQKLREIAYNLGVPKLLTDSLDTLPVYARSRSGRPGVKLDSSLPALFYEISPFKRDDIILTVDGISIHDLNKFFEYLKNQDKSKRFRVELEREKKLRIMEVYLK